MSANCRWWLGVIPLPFPTIKLHELLVGVELAIGIDTLVGRWVCWYYSSKAIAAVAEAVAKSGITTTTESGITKWIR